MDSLYKYKTFYLSLCFLNISFAKSLSFGQRKACAFFKKTEFFYNLWFLQSPMGIEKKLAPKEKTTLFAFSKTTKGRYILTFSKISSRRRRSEAQACSKKKRYIFYFVKNVALRFFDAAGPLQLTSTFR